VDSWSQEILEVTLWNPPLQSQVLARSDLEGEDVKFLSQSSKAISGVITTVRIMSTSKLFGISNAFVIELLPNLDKNFGKLGHFVSF